MNNEEKILQMLTQMQEDITALKQGQAELQQGQAELQQGQAELQQGQASIEKRVTKIQLTQENTIIPAIQILKEGQLTIQNQIKKLSVIDAMQDDIATLKSAVKFLSQELDKIQKAM